MKVLITGSDGLVGWHTRCFFHRKEDASFIACNRNQFADDDYLIDALRGCDAVIHLAGANRGDPEEVACTNRQITDRLVEKLEQCGSTPQLLFSNSIHVDLDTPYGQSKRYCGDAFRGWADRCGAVFTDLILPHIFGEHGKPFYNSVVSTFAHQLTHGEMPSIQSDGDLNLLHAGDVAELFQLHLEQRTNADVRPKGAAMKVSRLLDIFTNQWQAYEGGTIPELASRIETQLFNTLRSMLPAEKRPFDLTVHSDDRGDLFEAIRESTGGQVFYSTTKPGITRGDHYHTRKVERFLVVSGEATIQMRRLLTDEVLTYRVSGDKPQAIDMPTLFTHNITNVGDNEVKTLFWCNEHFNPEDPDTFFESA